MYIHTVSSLELKAFSNLLLVLDKLHSSISIELQFSNPLNVTMNKFLNSTR